jgi:hypothetical protein
MASLREIGDRVKGLRLCLNSVHGALDLVEGCSPLAMTGCGGEEPMHGVISKLHDCLLASDLLQESLGLPEGETEGWFAPLFRKER